MCSHVHTAMLGKASPACDSRQQSVLLAGLPLFRSHTAGGSTPRTHRIHYELTGRVSNCPNEEEAELVGRHCLEERRRVGGATKTIAV